MKKFLKNKLFISSASVLLVVIIALMAVFLIPDKAQISTAENTSESGDITVGSPGVNISLPVDTANTDETTEPTDQNKDTNENSDLVTNVNTDKSDDIPVEESKTPAKSADSPVTPVTPSQSDTGGIVIGDGDNCETSSQTYYDPETLAFISNLELEGCPYCGSHSCPSFYALDEWGHICYDATKCPEYNEHNDSAIYCPECGKKCGDGTNGTCVQFVTDCYCPNCGEFVKANTCHTCK